MLKPYADILAAQRFTFPFTRDSEKRIPSELLSDDWVLSIEPGDSKDFAKVKSEKLGVRLNYKAVDATVTNFLEEQIFSGDIEICQSENKSKITINGESNLVMFQDGLITKSKFDEAIDLLYLAKEIAIDEELDVGSIYLSDLGSLFIYLGYTDGRSGAISKKPRIIDIDFKFDSIYWAISASRRRNESIQKSSSTLFKIKKDKNIGKLVALAKLDQLVITKPNYSSLSSHYTLSDVEYSDLMEMIFSKIPVLQN